MARYIAVLIVCLSCSVSGAGEGTVSVTGGKISGTIDDGVRCYKGIPFAAPPVGDLRWREPQPVVPWQGVRECSRFGPVCPQRPYPEKSIYKSPKQPQSEDCLFLNVWTDAKSPDARLPVMVWIHGGALTRGSGSNQIYNGAALAKQGVVVVTINYRLGALGYLAHSQLTAESQHRSSGNYGVLDQLAALRWVKQNIAAFGGDPGRVTIFGESAGSWSVNTLLATPLSRGLVHRAIGQSGATFNRAPLLRDDESDTKTAEQIGEEFAAELQADSIAELRAKPVEEIVEASRKFRLRTNIDGWVLPDQVAAIYKAAQHNDVPLLIGSNRDEWTAFTAPAAIPQTMADFDQFISAIYGDKLAAFKEAYGVESEDDIKAAYLGRWRDVVFSLPMRTWARNSAGGRSNAYLYYFTRVPPVKNHDYLGAYHAAEIAYVFSNLHRLSIDDTDLDRKLSKTMTAYWVNFARTGNPNGPGLPHWPAYDQQQEHYLDLGETVEARRHLLKRQLDFLESLQP